MNKSFSKIWIIVIVAVLLAGGILAWQYWDWIKFQLRPGIPMQPAPPYIYILKSCSKNEDCGKDICQQGKEKCVEIKYICENGTCIFPAKTIEFPSPPYGCTESKCEKEVIEDETADWKTYRNEKYGYELKYPNNWYSRFTIFDEDFEITNGNDINNDLDIRTPLEAAGSAFINIPSFDEEILIADNIPAKKKTELIQADDYKWWRIVIQWKYKEGGVIIYDYPYEGKEDIDYLNIFNQMLSTIRFLE